MVTLLRLGTLHFQHLLSVASEEQIRRGTTGGRRPHRVDELLRVGGTFLKHCKLFVSAKNLVLPPFNNISSHVSALLSSFVTLSRSSFLFFLYSQYVLLSALSPSRKLGKPPRSTHARFFAPCFPTSFRSFHHLTTHFFCFVFLTDYRRRCLHHHFHSLLAFLRTHPPMH